MPRLPFSPGRGDRETVRFEKWGTGERGREDLSRLGAFPCGQVLTLRVTCLRRLGVSAVVLRLCRDGEAEADTPFAYISSDYVSGQDRYELTLDTAALWGADGAGGLGAAVVAAVWAWGGVAAGAGGGAGGGAGSGVAV